MENFNDKIAVITGASSGIGKAIALKLAESKFNLVLLGRNEQKLQEVKEQAQNLGSKVFILIGNLSEDDFSFTAMDKAKEFFGKIDILINNAGQTLNSTLENTDLNKFDELMNINCRAPYILCQTALKYLRNSDYATIINIASVVAHNGYVNQSAYTASKHALIGWTKSLAKEVFKDGIRVHVVSPGGVFTDMIAISRPDLTSDGMILPQDVANIVDFLIKNRTNAVIDEISLHRLGKEPFM